MDDLLDFYSDDGFEHCGLILTTGEIIELVNVAEDPFESFEISDDDLIKYEDQAIASWHTHPGQSSQLSLSDYEGFLSYPDLQHHIIGNDGVTSYFIKNGKVVTCV